MNVLGSKMSAWRKMLSWRAVEEKPAVSRFCLTSADDRPTPGRGVASGPHSLDGPTLRPLQGERAPRLSVAAKRELLAHARALEVPVDGRTETAIARDIQKAELAAAKQHDARVTTADMERAAIRAERAAMMTPARQSALFGFTRVVDARLSIGGPALAALADACDRVALLGAIDEGPGDGGAVWRKPATKEQLVASLVRQIVLKDGASEQIAVTPDLARFIEETAGVPIRFAMGGAGPFVANLAARLKNVAARFFSKGPLPAAIVERMGRGVEVVGPDGEAGAAVPVDLPSRTNYLAEYRDGEAIPLFGMTSLLVDGKPAPLRAKGDGVVILGTPAVDLVPGFDGVGPAVLRKMGREHDLFFFAGSHYLTQGSGDDARTGAQALARALDTMKEENPALVAHAQYVKPKAPENEAVVLGALAGHIDSFALNALEVPGLVDALHVAGMTPYHVDPLVPRAAVEDAAQMLDGAVALKDALALRRVHLHGYDGDLVIADADIVGGEDPERQQLALVRARQLAANKAANDSGEIKEDGDIWPTVASVAGKGLAAVERFADAIQERFGLDDAERDLVAEHWCFVDEKTGTAYHFAPSHGVHDKTGGTGSMGDTIDGAALLFALQPDRARPRAPAPRRPHHR
jgi:ADP-dependent phosphofructokinase/glucokinase